MAMEVLRTITMTLLRPEATNQNSSNYFLPLDPPPFSPPTTLQPPRKTLPLLSGKCKAIAPRQEEEQDNRFAPRAHHVLFDDKLSEDIWLDYYHHISNPTLQPKKEDDEEEGNFDSHAHVFDDSASEDIWLFAEMNYPFELPETRRVPLRIVGE